MVTNSFLWTTRGGNVLKLFGRSGVGSIRLAHVQKTPVQNFGFQYLQRQQTLGRPLSPHLNIYKPQLTWLISGGHRIAGCVMSGTLFVGVLLYSFGPFSYSNFIERVRGWQLPWPILAAAKFFVAWTIVFHTLNGIRFMCFDIAKGMELRQIYRTGYLVLALSTLLALQIVYTAQMNRKTAKNAPSE